MQHQPVLVSGVNQGNFYDGAPPVPFPFLVPINPVPIFISQPQPLAVPLNQMPTYYHLYNPCLVSMMVAGPPLLASQWGSPSQSCSPSGSDTSLLPPPLLVDHSRSCSPELTPMTPFTSISSCGSNRSSEGSQKAETKQELIHEVRDKLDILLSCHFPHKQEGKIMAVYAHDVMHELHEQRDVLRGISVGNIRAKSGQSLHALVEFVERILAPGSPHKVLRVDVILQKKKRGLLKGLLVNIQFANKKELLHVRRVIWKGQGFDEPLPKFGPAVFAQDCSWKGLPKHLNVYETPEGDLRVQRPFPKKLEELNLEEGCRIKSMSFSWKANSSRKVKTFEVPTDQFRQVLSEGKVTVKGVERPLNSRTTLTVSFEEDWKTAFWRTVDSAAPMTA